MGVKILVNIKEYKISLRKKYREIRNSLINKNKCELDEKIFYKIINLKEFIECKTLLCYVSTPIEVDTHRLIKYALNNGKSVAVPKCIDGTRNMKFYLINSFDDLEIATFSVLEPIIDKCKMLKNFDNSLCIIPGLAFDLKGYRLGYGKGYYDRFLSNYKGKTVGICYCSCTLNQLNVGKFDKSAEILVTEKYVRRINKS